jgi:hypothetical protein
MSDFFVQSQAAAYDSDDGADEHGSVSQYEEDTVASDVRSDVHDEHSAQAERDDRPVWLPFGDDDRDIVNARVGAAGAPGSAQAAQRIAIQMLVPREPVDDLIERVAARAPHAGAIPWRKLKSGTYFFGAQRVDVRLHEGTLFATSRRRDEPLEHFLLHASKTELARARGAQAHELMRSMQQM